MSAIPEQTCSFCDAVTLAEAVEFTGADQADLVRRAGHWLTEHQSPGWQVATIGVRGWPGAWSLVMYLDAVTPPPCTEGARVAGVFR